jgi:phospho-N-acetylmuramoyl-pentapeptide-transferase
MAFLTGIIFSMFIGKKLILVLKRRNAVEEIDEDMPENHKSKKGTPTMGGIIILAGLLISSLLWNDISNNYIIMMYLTTIWLGLFGFLDDYLKNFVKSKKGLIPKYKLLGQVSIALFISIAIFYLYRNDPNVTRIQIPFLKDTSISLGYLFIPFVVFMITGTSNAVNLTDGLDGLAAGVIAFSVIGLGVMAYLKGNFVIASYLNIEFIGEAAELTVFNAALLGTLMGFLWYNTHPAEIFMGDTGSLALGGMLAQMSILLREQIFFAIIGMIFITETLSVIIQTRYFKFTKKKYGVGKRVFLCAPLHHHFEKKGLKESKIVVRFWIVSILLLALGLATIKLR